MKFSTVVALGIACTICVMASAAPPTIETALPNIVQRGTQFEMRIVGAELRGAKELMYYRGGLKTIDLSEVSENELIVTIEAEKDCVAGSVPFRLRTRDGISELRIVRICTLPIVAEPDRGPELQDFPTIELNSTISGVLQSGEIDRYRISARKGTRLTAEVEAMRLGISLLDTVLTVYDPNGNKLAMADDTALFRQDPFLTWTASMDGNYTVEIREANYGGDENSRYALHVGSFPRPSRISPPGAPLGQQIELTFLDDAGGKFQQELEASCGPSGTVALFAKVGSRSAPTSIPFRCSPFDNVNEAEPNARSTPPSSVATQLPIAFNGVLEQPGDVDTFWFQGDPEHIYRFEVFAQRLGSTADTLISILSETGELLSNNDDTDSHDSLIEFQAPEEGRYSVAITDKLARGSDQSFYRIEATLVTPELVAFVPRPDRLSQQLQTVSVPQGNRTLVRMGVRRRMANGPVDFSFTELPSGVTVSSQLLNETEFWRPIVFEAMKDASLSGSLASVKCTAVDQQQSITGGFQQVIDLVNGPADALYWSETVDRLAVAVVSPVPFQIELEEPRTSLAIDGTLDFQVRVIRQTGFSGAIDVSFPFLPPHVDGPSKITIPPNQDTAIYPVRSHPQAIPSTWSLCCEASVNAVMTEQPKQLPSNSPLSPTVRSMESLRDTHVCSKLVTLTLVDSPIQGSLLATSAEQGTKATMSCKLDFKGHTCKEMQAALEGLPNRVDADDVSVDRGANEVRFQLALDANAPIGSFQNLYVKLTGRIDGESVSYCVGRGGALQIVPPGQLVVDQHGKPLSPLEVLRAKKRRTTLSDSQR